MPGFAGSISNNINCVFANNADFSGNGQPNDLNGLQTDGQLWIGSTALNVGGTHINIGKLTSSGTITIGYSAPNITIDVAGGSVVNTIHAGTNINISGTASNPIINLNDPILQQNDSAAAPSYSWANLTNSGLYQGGNQVHMSVGGGETVRFSSDNTLFLFRANMTALQYSGNFQSTSAASFTPNAQNTLYIACDPTSNTITVNLPNAANDGQIFIIKDSTGKAATNNITVTTPGGTKTFDGATSVKIITNYGSLSLLYNPTTTNYEIF